MASAASSACSGRCMLEPCHLCSGWASSQRVVRVEMSFLQGRLLKRVSNTPRFACAQR